MTPRTRAVVRATEIGAAAVAAVLSPIPLADEIVIAPALLGVAAAIGRDHGVSFAELPWGSLVRTAVAGLAARAALNLAVAAVPGVAAIANALTAYALTRAYADWAVGATRPARNAARATPPAPGMDGVVTQAS